MLLITTHKSAKQESQHLLNFKKNKKLQTLLITAKQKGAQSGHLACPHELLDSDYFAFPYEGRLTALQLIQPIAMWRASWFHRNLGSLHKNDNVQKPLRRSSSATADLKAMQKRDLHLQ
jgi:hypothetical protein